MGFVTKLLLALIYLLTLPLRFCHMLRGHDRVRLKEPRSADSFWITRDETPDSNSYFLESSVAEGRGETASGTRGAAWWITPLLLLVSKAYAPPREVTSSRHSRAERDESIPDEVYTLW